MILSYPSNDRRNAVLYQNNEDYQTYLYKKDLRKTANGLGIILLIIFALEIILANVVTVILRLTGAENLISGDSELLLLENGMLSSILFFLIALTYVLIKKRSFGALFPFEKIGAKKLFMLCVAGLFFSLLSNLAPDLLTNVFGLAGLSNTGATIEFADNPPSLLMYILTVAIMPAFTEEFAFRGVVMGSLRKYSDGLALVVSAALFALTHGNFVQIPFTFCCGLVFGFMVLKTNSLLPSIIVHFLNNGLSVIFDLLYEHKIIPAHMVNFFYGLIIVVTGLLTFFFLRILAKEDENFFKLDKADDVIPFRQKMKTVAGSPTLISYTIIMLLFAVYVMLQPYLIRWGVIQY